MSINSVYIYNTNNKKNLFNRKKFVSGINRQGYFIPLGGVILKNGNLAGYILKGGYKEWTEVGHIKNKVEYKIPTYKNLRKITGKKNTINSALKNLRNYYINQLN